MIGLARRAVRGVRWRANILLGTGARRPPRGSPAQYGSDAVSEYYDRFTATYLDATGPFLQAFRSSDTDALMEYYVQRAGIEDGMTVLDAGCGVGAPATWLAQRFGNLRIECLTNSSVQADEARKRAHDVGVADRVTVTLGDYHNLAGTYSAGQFDRALFLETLGHSADTVRVLYGLRDVLRQGGEAYIKDFFQRRSRNPKLQGRIDEAVAVINANYCYHVMQLPDLIANCIETGFTIASITPPAIVPDLKLTVDFEHAAGRLTYPVFARLHAVDWYEVVARRE